MHDQNIRQFVDEQLFRPVLGLFAVFAPETDVFFFATHGFETGVEVGLVTFRDRQRQIHNGIELLLSLGTQRTDQLGLELALEQVHDDALVEP